MHQPLLTGVTTRLHFGIVDRIPSNCCLDGIDDRRAVPFRRQRVLVRETRAFDDRLNFSERVRPTRTQTATGARKSTAKYGPLTGILTSLSIPKARRCDAGASFFRIEEAQ